VGRGSGGGGEHQERPFGGIAVSKGILVGVVSIVLLFPPLFIGSVARMSAKFKLPSFGHFFY
jgi:hypothetical protein